MVLNGGKTRFTPIIAIAGIAALALATACLVRGKQGVYGFTVPKTPAYFRMNVSQDTAVYLEFKGSELRMAMSAEGLKTAAPVAEMPTSNADDGNNMLHFQESTLPIPPDHLPAGVTAVKATFSLFAVERPPYEDRTTTFLSGEIAICRMDEKKTEWQYVMPAVLRAGDSADKAPATQLPIMGKVMTVSVTGQPANGALGVGVVVQAGRMNLSDLRKNAKPVDVQLTVLDASGKQVASKTGPLSAFGFS